MTDKEIIAATLRELPAGYIPNHTPESIPERVRFYVQEYAKLSQQKSKGGKNRWKSMTKKQRSEEMKRVRAKGISSANIPNH